LAESQNYLETVSPLPFEPTLDRLMGAIEDANMTVFARIDHAKGAREAGMSMPPTVVLIYGNPKGGTPVMLAAPSTALDLPLRVLVREEAAGQTFVSFRPIAETLVQAGVPDAMAARLELAQRSLIEAIDPQTPA
jgi:uncharacterized protein (DUF302 family)